MKFVYKNQLDLCIHIKNRTMFGAVDKMEQRDIHVSSIHFNDKIILMTRKTNTLCVFLTPKKKVKVWEISRKREIVEQKSFCMDSKNEGLFVRSPVITSYKMRK